MGGCRRSRGGGGAGRAGASPVLPIYGEVARRAGGAGAAPGSLVSPHSSSPFMGRWPFPPHLWGGAGEAGGGAGPEGPQQRCQRHWYLFVRRGIFLSSSTPPP